MGRSDAWDIKHTRFSSHCTDERVVLAPSAQADDVRKNAGVLAC